MAKQFADILGDAAAHRLPRDAVWSIFALTSMRYVTLLSPIALFLGVMLALARLNRDGERRRFGVRRRSGTFALTRARPHVA